ncbi:MAG TPA: hypothetical protein V6D14_20995 [Coleofasciculaceae cyanobacterium]
MPDSIPITLIYFVRNHLDWRCDRRRQSSYLISQIQDITKRKFTQESLRKSEQRWT